MANRKEHIKTGAFAGGAAGFSLNILYQVQKIKNGKQKEFEYWPLVLWTAGGVAVGAVGGMLPDLLEPAKNPRHRKFFHSVTSGLIVLGGVVAVNKSQLPIEAKVVCSALGVGYLSHLVLDGKTKFGLPIV